MRGKAKLLMLRLASVGIGALFVAGTLAGCASRQHRCRGVDAVLLAADTEIVERGEMLPPLDALTSYESVHLSLEHETTPSRYRRLRAEQCGRLAAANSVLASAIELERRLSLSAGPSCRSAREKAQCIQSSMLSHRIVAKRNRAAAAALELFYRLAEAEASRDLIQSSLEEIDRMIEYFEELEDGGFQTEADEHAMRARRVDMLDRRAELESKIPQLNGSLRQLLGFDTNDRTPIWPAADLQAAAEPIDLEAALSEGLANRADLATLCLLSAVLEKSTLPVVRAALSQMDGALGTSSARACKLLPCSAASGSREELAIRWRQLHRLLVNQEELAAEEIRQAAGTLETSLTRIALAREKLRHRQRRLDRLRGRRDVGGVTAFDISLAELEVLEARGALTRQAVARRIARVKLKEAQGLLALECGYCLPAACCPTCFGR